MLRSLFQIMFGIFLATSSIHEIVGAAALLSKHAATTTMRTTDERRSSTGPPIGAKYECVIRLPVIGKQIFSLHILSHTRAHLLVDGMLVLDESVPYTVDTEGLLAFNLSEYAVKKLKRFRTNLQEVGYNAATDTPYVKVAPPLPKVVTLFLERKDVSE